MVPHRARATPDLSGERPAASADYVRGMSGTEQRRHERQQDGQEQARREPEDQADDQGSGQGGQGGQVSEVGDLSRADEPISDDQSVAGQPDGESGEVDEGPTGPNSRAGSDRN